MLSDNVTKITNSPNNSPSNFNSAEDHGKSLVNDGPYQEEQIPEILPTNVPDSDIAQLKHTSVCEANVIVPEIMVPASPSLCEDDKKTDAFLDEVHKKNVSNDIRQRKREKKLQGELIIQESSPAINTSCITDLSTTSTELVTLPEQVAEESIPKESSAESAMSCELKLSSGNKQDPPPKKIPYNQRVEQDLICELLEFIRCHNSTPLPNSISSKHIPDVPVDADLTPGSVLHLAHLFDKAEKTSRKEKL